jgi:hypothetical protein
MIPKMSSQELNKIFKDAQVNNVLFEKKLEAIKDDMGKKINIIKYENAFINKKLDVIDTGLIANDSLVSFNKNSYGMFNEYGYMIHPKFKKTPIDLMNLKLPEGGNYFKEGIITKVNGVEMPSYTNILMADNHITKGITFDEYNTENISLEFSLSNELLLGVMRFNTIEIDPYIYGAYDLLSIDIYTLDSTNNITAEPTIVLNGFDNIARTRIILKEKVKFTKVVFNFKVNYKTEKNFVDIFPFGLKHIHFYEADYVEDSFVITQFVSDKFIEYVMNNMTLYTTQGKLDIDAMDYGIEVYTDYENNTLMGKVNLSTEASIYRIPKNTKTIYIKIPLLQKNIKTKEKTYLCLNGVGLNFTTNQEIIL